MKHGFTDTTNVSLGEKLEGMVKNLHSSEVTLVEIYESIGNDT